MVAGFEAYKTYLAVKNHFNQKSYSFIKYCGKVRANEVSFLNRRDKFFFQKLERNYRKDELPYFFVANFMYNDVSWSGEFNTDTCKQAYINWQQYYQAVQYNFGVDCKVIKKFIKESSIPFDRMFVAEAGDPPILNLYLMNKIRVDSLIITDKILNFFKNWEKQTDNMLLQDQIKKLTKYSEFITFIDVPELRKIMKEVFKDED